MKEKLKFASIMIIITTLLDIIVMITTFKTHNITWYLIALSIINIWYFLPFFFTKEVFILGVSIASCYFVFDSLWLAIMIGLIWWVIAFDIETIINYKKAFNLINNTEEPEIKEKKMTPADIYYSQQLLQQHKTEENDKDVIIKKNVHSEKFQEFLDKNIPKGKGKTIKDVKKQ